MTIIPMKVNAAKTLTQFMTNVSSTSYTAQVRTMNALASDNLTQGQIIKIPYEWLTPKIQEIITSVKRELAVKKYLVPGLIALAGVAAFVYMKRKKKIFA